MGRFNLMTVRCRNLNFSICVFLGAKKSVREEAPGYPVVTGALPVAGWPSLSLPGGSRWSGFPGGAVVRNPPAVQATQEMRIRSLGREDSPGGGHSNSLHYSCLENSTDTAAWRATVHRVSKSRTRLSASTFLKPFSGLTSQIANMSEDSLVEVHRNPKRGNWLVWWPDHVKARCGWGRRVSWTRDSRQLPSAVIFCQSQGSTSVWMLAHSFRFFHTIEPHPSIWTKDKGDALFSSYKNVISWLLHC